MVASWLHDVAWSFHQGKLHELFFKDGITFATWGLAAATALLVFDNWRGAREQRERRQREYDESHALRFTHGLQLDPPNAGLFANKPVEVWVANLGSRSFFVRAIEIRRHDRRGAAFSRWQGFHPGEIWFDWDEVVQPGERRALPLNDQGFWRGAPLAGVDVEVTVEIRDGDQRTARATNGFLVCVRHGSSQPNSIEKGFGALWFPLCPKCGKQKGMFQPKGLNSFAEVDEDWIKAIQRDFEQSCPNHQSKRLIYEVG